MVEVFGLVVIKFFDCGICVCFVGEKGNFEGVGLYLFCCEGEDYMVVVMCLYGMVVCNFVKFV